MEKTSEQDTMHPTLAHKKMWSFAKRQIPDQRNRQTDADKRPGTPNEHKPPDPAKADWEVWITWISRCTAKEKDEHYNNCRKALYCTFKTAVSFG